MRVSIYRYGLLSPRDWNDDCEEELRRMTALWNQLVEIEHDHRAKVRALTADDPAVAAAQAAAERLAEKLHAAKQRRKEANKNARRRVPNPELNDEIARLLAELKDAGSCAADARRQARARIKDKLDALDQERKAAVKTARQQSALYWGNYNAVVADYERARSRAMKIGAELKFHRHCAQPTDGKSSARMVNQIQGGVTVAELLGGKSSQVALAHGRPLSMLRFTVHRRKLPDGTGNGTVTWPICYADQQARNHARPLPDDAIVQEAVVTRRSVADAWEWSVSFLLRLPAPVEAAIDNTACGIDLGWRRVNDGLRVATIAHDDGTHEFLTLPAIFLRRMERVKELAGMRTTSADGLRLVLRDLDWPNAPEPLRPLAMRALRTRRPEDIHLLALEWRKYPRWHAYEAQTLGRWRARDRIDWQEQAGLARRIANARRDIYRCAVKRLTARYGIIGIEDVNWRDIGAVESRDGQPNDIAMMSAEMRQLASPGSFNLELVRAAREHASRIHREAGKSTWPCSECAREGRNTVVVPADRSALIQTCPHNHVWDQDKNAATNLRAAALASASVLQISRPPLAGSKRWKKKGLAESDSSSAGMNAPIP